MDTVAQGVGYNVTMARRMTHGHTETRTHEYKDTRIEGNNTYARIKKDTMPG
jgi:hypothetical protein